MAEQDKALATRTPKQQTILTFNNVVNGDYIQKQLKKTCGENAGTFTTSLVELFTNSTELQECDPKKVVNEAIKAASLHLPISKSLKRAYILTFKNKGKKEPCMVIGWQGLVDLAQRSGLYSTINTDVVYEGELTKKDKLSGFIDLTGEKESDTILGFFGYFELIKGFKKNLYITLEEMCKYAKKYAPTLKYDDKTTWEDLYKLAQEQAKSGPTGIGWKGDFISMAKKTCIRQILNYGPMSIEMQNAVQYDEEFNNAEVVRNEVVNQPKVTINAEVVSDNVQDAQAEELKQPDLGSLND